MKAKEKAKELVYRFYHRFYPYNSIQPETVHIFEKAKECALICVDEIISIPSIQGAYAQGYNNSKSTESYWQEVKKAIKKL